MTEPLTTAQAEALTAWLRDLTAYVVDRRKCRLAEGQIWVGRWTASVLQQYCQGATPAEAYAALDTKPKGWTA